MARKKTNQTYKAKSNGCVYTDKCRIELSQASQDELKYLYDAGHRQYVELITEEELTTDEAENNTCDTGGGEADTE
jgi:hypothetical protein